MTISYEVGLGISARPRETTAAALDAESAAPHLYLRRFHSQNISMTFFSTTVLHWWHADSLLPQSRQCS